MYWVLWLLIGLMLVAIYSICVLPKIFHSALAAIKGAGKYKVLYVLEFAALFSAAVFLFVFVIATFVYQCVGGLEVGAGRAAPFVVWTIYVFVVVMAVTFIVGMTIKSEGESGEKIDLRFMLPTIKINLSYKIGVVFDILFAVLLIVASVMMALFFDYAMLRLFGTAMSKRLLLVLIGVEICVIAVIERKSLKKLLKNLPKTIIPLFVAFALYYIVLLTASREAVEWIFVVGGSALFIAIVMFYVWSLISRRSKKQLEKNTIR